MPIPGFEPGLRGKALVEALKARRTYILSLPLTRESHEMMLQFKTDVTDSYMRLIEYIEELEAEIAQARNADANLCHPLTTVSDLDSAQQ